LNHGNFETLTQGPEYRTQSGGGFPLAVTGVDDDQPVPAAATFF
jgi:hypothetical protein